jgi:hypothetical protein
MTREQQQPRLEHRNLLSLFELIFVVSSCVPFSFSLSLVGVSPHSKQEQVLLLALLFLLLFLLQLFTLSIGSFIFFLSPFFLSLA